MKRKTLRRSTTREKKRMKGSLAIVKHLGQVSLVSLLQQSSSESKAQATKSQSPSSSSLSLNFDAIADDKDCILNQDFFCQISISYFSIQISSMSMFLGGVSPIYVLFLLLTLHSVAAYCSVYWCTLFYLSITTNFLLLFLSYIDCTRNTSTL
ncbi:NADH-ubiquinone oxidoreductase [Actinidia chinensis var. chinensis]|uniref:NADH-ubiquinone oxidoreductase n=1 Tax=Actinidia chinensis var. chinensis TaxID=1590841 RepID=A0A2R6R5Z0_ACTCC|nr:NADH-ubiquinone oxidoreductase [Actinidia chinensis var. chinensis]